MILETLGSREFSNLSELLAIAENSGKEAIRVLTKNLETDTDDELA